MQTNPTPEQWAVELMHTALAGLSVEDAALTIQAAFAEQNARHVAMEKRARDLSIMLVAHLGGGSEWFSQIGEEYYADPKSIGPELQRRKTDAQITKGALIRANKATADQAEQNARLVGALEQLDLELADRGYGIAGNMRQLISAALKDRTYG